MIKLLDIENKRVKVTPHCHTISWLKVIMEKFPEEEQHIKIYVKQTMVSRNVDGKRYDLFVCL